MKSNLQLNWDRSSSRYFRFILLFFVSSAFLPVCANPTTGSATSSSKSTEAGAEDRVANGENSTKARLCEPDVQGCKCDVQKFLHRLRTNAEQLADQLRKRCERGSCTQYCIMHRFSLLHFGERPAIRGAAADELNCFCGENAPKGCTLVGLVQLVQRSNDSSMLRVEFEVLLAPFKEACQFREFWGCTFQRKLEELKKLRTRIERLRTERALPDTLHLNSAAGKRVQERTRLIKQFRKREKALRNRAISLIVNRPDQFWNNNQTNQPASEEK